MFSPEKVIALLQTAGHGVPGKTLFAYNMPAEVKNGVLVLNNILGMKIDQELPNWRVGRFQVVCKGESIPGVIAKAEAISKTLQFEGWRTLPATANFPAVEVYKIWPIHEPIVFPRPLSDTIEASVNYDIFYKSN